MRVERGEFFELHLGDCLDPATGLATLAAVDHVITDPPYSERVHSGVRSSGLDVAYETESFDKAATRRHVDLGFEHLRPEVMAGVAHHIGRITKRWALVFSDMESNADWKREIEIAGLKHYVVGAWERVNGAPRFNGLGPAPSFEAIEIACKRAGWNGGGKRAKWAVPIVLNRGAGESRVHPTQKPLALMEALVRDFTDPGEIICDPFAGSGTTGVAAIRLGRRFIGWERDPEFFAVASTRLHATRTQIEIWEASAPGKQESLL